MSKRQVARWYTGCYINEEDACFEQKTTNSFGPFDWSDTDNISGEVRAAPVPTAVKVSIGLGIFLKKSCPMHL